MRLVDNPKLNIKWRIAYWYNTALIHIRWYFKDRHSSRLIDRIKGVYPMPPRIFLFKDSLKMTVRHRDGTVENI